MPNELAGGATPRMKTIPIFLMVDVSGSMGGEKIAAVNEAIDNLVPIYQEIANEDKSVNYTLRVMTYGNEQADWRVGTKVKGVPIDELQWLPISDEEVDGDTPADLAMDLLASVSNSREYLGGLVGTPMAILISDGESNGDVPFETAVDKFRKTKFGERFIQVAIGIGTENNPEAMSELQYFGRNGFVQCTENPEDIIKCLVEKAKQTLRTVTEATRKGEAAVVSEELFT